MNLKITDSFQSPQPFCLKDPLFRDPSLLSPRKLPCLPSFIKFLGIFFTPCLQFSDQAFYPLNYLPRPGGIF